MWGKERGVRDGWTRGTNWAKSNLTDRCQHGQLCNRTGRISG